MFVLGKQSRIPYLSAGMDRLPLLAAGWLSGDPNKTARAPG